jgi:hypothetical protein
VTLRGSFAQWRKRRERTCLDCGFFSRGSLEVNLDERVILQCRGKTAESFSDPESFGCSKGLWFTLGDHDPNVILLDQVEQPRSIWKYRLCQGFRLRMPGRSPAEHLKLEDESRQFRRQLWIAGVAFVGALVGAVLGVLLKKL